MTSASSGSITANARFSLRRPSAGHITAFLAAQERAAFSYPEVGATRGAPPAGYAIDQNRVALGAGEATFHSALAALHEWRMFSLGWVEAHPSRADLTPGLDVAVLVHHYGMWSLHAARVVYVVDDERDGVRCAGFAYGTLAAHAEVGEERFTVEWNRSDDTVWYALYALSRPRHPLARLGAPLARRLQHRFARESLRAMRRAV